MFKKKLKTLILNNKGMSLLEIIIAVMLIGMISTTFLNMFLYAFNLSIQAQEITNHTYAVQAVMENTRAMDYRQLQSMSRNRQAYDSNGDGVNDCFVRTTFEPYGIDMKEDPADSSDPSDAIYLHIIYYGNDIMIIAPDGTSIFYEDISAVTYYKLEVDSNSTQCKLSIGSNSDNDIDFNRESITSKVVVVVNLEMKEASYTNTFFVQDQMNNATNDAVIKLLGGPSIGSTVVFQKSTPDEKYLGVMNLSTSLVKVRIDLYKEVDSAEPSISMCEILEVNNGEPDTQVGG